MDEQSTAPTRAQAVDLLRARNWHDLDNEPCRFCNHAEEPTVHGPLSTGLEVTVAPPRLRDCIAAGDIPLPVLEHMKTIATGKGRAKSAVLKKLTAEDVQHIRRFQDEIVRATIKQIRRQPVEVDLDAVDALEQAEYDEVAEIGLRYKTIPKAGAPT